MSLLRIKDNSQHNKDAFSSISGLVSRIADKSLEQLERDGVFVFPDLAKDAEGLTTDQMVLQSVNDQYKTGNVMGFIGFGDERLVIESRFGSGEDDFFLQYMLNQVLDMPSIVDLKVDTIPDDRFFNYLLFLFPRYLIAAMRKGPFKEYVRRNYNDGNVKGTVDVARHIVKNTPFIGNIAYSQREFSFDNDLMELIRHTVEYIKGKPYGNKVLSKAKSDVDLVIEATPRYEPSARQRIIVRNNRSPIRHAYFREYMALQKLCILILRHQKHQVGSGTRQIYGILFDGSWLWEEYVAKLVEETFYHPSNKKASGTQYLFDKSIGRVYPDFINRDPRNRVIADAKYKPINNIGNKDYLQVLAYMFRFDAKEGFYLYPEADENKSQRLRMNMGSTYEGDVAPREDVGVVKHGLRIPISVSSYEEFVEHMQSNEEIFKIPLLMSTEQGTHCEQPNGCPVRTTRAR